MGPGDLHLLDVEVRIDAEQQMLTAQFRVTGAPASISELYSTLARGPWAATAEKLANALGSSSSGLYGAAGHPHRGVPDQQCHARLVDGRECRLPLAAHQGHRYEGGGDECAWTGDGGQLCYRTRREHPRG